MHSSNPEGRPVLARRAAQLLLVALLPCALASGHQGGGGFAGRGRNLSAKGGQAGGANRPTRPKSDYAAARQKLLDAAKSADGTPVDPATIDVKDFGALITAAGDEANNRKLPSFNENPENNYAPELIAFRAEVYGPLREDPVLRAFLRGLAGKAASAFDFNSTTAAMVLADAPDAEDLDAIFKGYDATAIENRTPLARQLGRALGAARGKEPKPARFDVGSPGTELEFAL